MSGVFMIKGYSIVMLIGCIGDVDAQMWQAEIAFERGDSPYCRHFHKGDEPEFKVLNHCPDAEIQSRINDWWDVLEGQDYLVIQA